MNIIVIIVYVAFSCLIGATIGAKRKIGAEWSFLFCILFSPAIGLIITLLSSKKPKDNETNNP